jgi:hypothetical protein
MMAQQKDDLALGTGLIKKGEARGLSPALAAPVAREEAVAAPPPSIGQATAPVQEAAAPAPTPAAYQPAEETDPPLRAAPPDDVAKRFTSFRLPVALDEDLRAMMFETRRSKQDLLIDFVTEGIKAWRQERTKRR